jgi:DNA-binding transcriptional LysR family regulator
VRNLNAQLGLRLLTRITRNVSPTEAGDRLIHSVGPRLDEIGAELAALAALCDKPAGTVRIADGEHAAELLLWPVIEQLVFNTARWPRRPRWPGPNSR